MKLFIASLLQAIDGVMSFALCPKGWECLKLLNTSDLPKSKPFARYLLSHGTSKDAYKNYTFNLITFADSHIDRKI